MVKKIFKIKGMHCNSCSNLIKESLKNVEGIGKVEASYAKEEVSVEFNSDNVSESKIKKVIEGAGYVVEDKEEEKLEKVGEKFFIPMPSVFWPLVSW